MLCISHGSEWEDALSQHHCLASGHSPAASSKLSCRVFCKGGCGPGEMGKLGMGLSRAVEALLEGRWGVPSSSSPTNQEPGMQPWPSTFL